MLNTVFPLKMLRSLTIISSFVLYTTACTPSSDSGEHPEQTLHLSIGASPQALDPHLIAGVPAMKVISSLFEPLLLMNTDTLQPEAGAAETWSVDDNGLRYVFKLRDNARWSDGSPVTAHDFVFTWQRILSPGIGHYYAQDFYPIIGAQQYHQGKSEDFSSVGVKALSDHQLEFSLHSPDPLFLKRLTHDTTSPVQKANILSFGTIDNPVSRWTQPPNMVSNGPFMLTRWELNKVLVAEKNPHYWKHSAVTLERIVFYPNEDTAVEERMFRSGQLQVAYGGSVPAEKIATYRQQAPDKLVITDSYATYYYDFNTQRPPFNNVDVRKAFAFAVDREKIVEKIAKAGQQPAYTLSPVDDFFQPSSALEFNPEKARDFLAAAGYPNGEGFPIATLIYNTHEQHRKVSIALQQMWKKHLNVEVQIENQEWKVFLGTRRQHDFDIARDGSSSTFADPMDFLTTYTTGHELNTPNWQNPEFDALLVKARVETDFEKRMTLLEQAETLFMEHMPVVPLYYYAYSYLISPEVKGMKFNRIEKPDYRAISIDKSSKEH